MENRVTIGASKFIVMFAVKSDATLLQTSAHRHIGWSAGHSPVRDLSRTSLSLRPFAE
jgi:hypothetical protein